MKKLLAIAVAIGLGAAFADAATMCVRKNGRLVLRPACRSGERPFDPTGFTVDGPDGPAGPQGPAGDPATFPLRIVDASEEEVGEIWEFQLGSAWIRIRRPPLDEPVLFFVASEGFPPTKLGDAGLWYQSADCAGVPYIADDGADFARAQVYGAAAYYSTAVRGDVAVQSNEFDYAGRPCPQGTSATPRAMCCQNYTQQLNYIRPAVRVELVSLGLRPPFRAVRRQEVPR